MAATSAASVRSPARQAPEAPPHPHPRARPRRRPEQRTGITGGVVGIVVAAALLAGVVAMNVAVLRLNVQLSELGRQRVTLQAENAALAAQLSSAAALSRIEDRARRKLGLVPAAPDETLYLRLTPKRR